MNAGAKQEKANTNDKSFESDAKMEKQNEFAREATIDLDRQHDYGHNIGHRLNPRRGSNDTLGRSEKQRTSDGKRQQQFRFRQKLR
jgi:hypothetical protein